MIRQLHSLLPIGIFKREVLRESLELHHFGTLNSSVHTLNRPIWVSDIYGEASQYRYFGVPAPFYTKLTLADSVEIINIGESRLQPIAMKLKIYDHSEWNNVLSEYLKEHRIAGLVYAGREIFLADPKKIRFRSVASEKIA
jgi:hypothetical protein